jgi:pimeloyl-ACP methyl ester carboxylesterase
MLAKRLSDAPPAIVFSHANGFPAATYSTLFAAWRKAGYAVHAIEKFGHDPDYPVTNNWPRLRDQLVDFVRRDVGRPAFLVGHSLGGYVSVLAASHAPQLVRGVVLLDSPIVGGWRGHSLRMAKLAGLMPRMSPGKVAQRRRHEWPSAEAVHAHFSSKPVFARWHAGVLDDYVAHGTEPWAQGRRLAFQREVETIIYNTLPHDIPDRLRRHPLRAPCAFIGGTQSVELRQVGLAATRQLTHGRLSWMEGSHLFPFEKPLETAHEVVRWLRELDRLAPAQR